jgi:hypothetical protein
MKARLSSTWTWSSCPCTRRGLSGLSGAGDLFRTLPRAHSRCFIAFNAKCLRPVVHQLLSCRVKDKVRRLARHHKVFLTDVQKLHDNLDRTKHEARSALEAKKRVLLQAIERRYDEALEAVDDEVQAKKLPLDQAAGDIKRSSAVLEAALETLEDKLKEPQQDFIQRFVPMIEVQQQPGQHTQGPAHRCYANIRTRCLCRNGIAGTEAEHLASALKTGGRDERSAFAGHRVACQSCSVATGRVRRTDGRRPGASHTCSLLWTVTHWLMLYQAPARQHYAVLQHKTSSARHGAMTACVWHVRGIMMRCCRVSD